MVAVDPVRTLPTASQLAVPATWWQDTALPPAAVVAATTPGFWFCHEAIGRASLWQVACFMQHLMCRGIAPGVTSSERIGVSSIRLGPGYRETGIADPDPFPRRAE